VSHFVYDLWDIIFPDFLCQFHLFRGDPLVPIFSHFDAPEGGWLSPSKVSKVMYL
jgi:hypothetical protein